jgi:hypothetical protein
MQAAQALKPRQALESRRHNPVYSRFTKTPAKHHQNGRQTAFPRFTGPETAFPSCPLVRGVGPALDPSLRNPTMSSPTITFRLEPAHYRRLTNRAAGEPINLFARELLLRALAEDELAARFEAHLGRTEASLGDLRRDLSTAMQTLLVWQGKLPPEEAKRWADEHLSS